MTFKISAKLFILCLVIMQLASCKKDGSTPVNTLPVTASSIAGDFTVNSFVSTTDQTSEFSGYHFTFNENGTITATKDNSTVNGTWKFDDSDATEMKISFPVSPLSELNKGWHINELTDNHLLLTDDNASEDNNDDNPSSHSSLEFERD